MDYHLRGWLGCGALLLGAAAGVVAAERTDAIDETVADYFRPYQHDLARLSPDGKYLAMSERAKNGASGIVVVDLDARSSKSYFLSSTDDHAAQQLLWASPTRLLFTTRGRSVGAIEIGEPEVRPLLSSKDLDAYRPEPILGPRSDNVAVTPDRPASGTITGPGEFNSRQEISAAEALQQAQVTGDLFDSRTKGDAGRSLRPVLIGLKPGAPSTVLVELCGAEALYSYGGEMRLRVTVPGNVYISDSRVPPASTADIPGFGTTMGGYAAYDISYRPPPLVVLELDVAKGRTREVVNEDGWRRVWCDHQGRLRLALEQHGKRFRYLYRAAEARKWVPLDSIVKEPTPLGFDVGPENLLAARSVPLGFDVEGHRLYFASNVGRETFVLRTLELTQGRLEEFEVGTPQYDLIEPTALTAGDALRFDPGTHNLVGIHYGASRHFTQWFDPNLKALHATVTKNLQPQRSHLVEWNAGSTRFLVETSTPGDPGGFFVVEPATSKLIRCGDRAPWLTAERRNQTHQFDFVGDGGRRFSGLLTLPRKPRLNPAPVLVYFHDGPWFSDSPTFNRGAQALAALGFAVLQLNHRGSGGLGRAHLTAIAGGLDRAVLEDVREALARLGSGKLPINVRMAAALGNGIGGYLAVRMAQLAPETFRCAVAINTPGDLEAWRVHPDLTQTLLADQRKTFFGTERDHLRAQSALAAAPTTKAPVLVVHAADNTYVPVALGRALYHALKKSSDETAFLELPGEGHGGWSEKTTARLFAELGRFFNATIYNYRVDVRTPEVVR